MKTGRPSLALVAGAFAGASLFGHPSAAQVTGSVAPSPSTNECTGEQVQELVSGLELWTRRYREAEQQAYAECRCERPSTVCLDRVGEPLRDKWPARATAGSTLVVCAILPRSDSGKVSISSASPTSNVESLLGSAAPSQAGAPAPMDERTCEPSQEAREAIKAAAAPIARLASRPGLESLGIPAGSGTDAYWNRTGGATLVKDWAPFAGQGHSSNGPEFVAMSSHVTVPFGDVLRVSFRRTERDARESSADKHYELPIDNGRYYLELALLIPFVYKGSRSVELVPAPGTGDLRVATREDWHVTGAVMLDFFPLGRGRALGTSFRNCRTRSCAENWLGLQVGAGFHSFLKEWYLGLVVEPVSGLNFNFGTALLKGEFLPPGRAEGMQLPSADALVASSEYMLRPYLGFSITLDVVAALDRRARAGQLF